MDSIEKNFSSKSLIEKVLQVGKNYQIIDFDYDRCSITILGDINENEKNEKMILKIKKKEFELLNQEKFSPEYSNKLTELITSLEKHSKIIFNNDIYYKLISQTIENGVKIDFIYPVDKKVIDKYSKKNFILFTESYETYLNKTKKYIDDINPNHTQWIDNALYNDTEEILFSIPQKFIILKDFSTVENKNILNCLGLSYLKLNCIRDLDAGHLELLELFYIKGREALSKLFNTNLNKIRAYVHYQPTFYHFHVHYLDVDLESSSISINRAFDLFQIIQNIKFDSDYYQKIDIQYVLIENSPLYRALIENSELKDI